MIFQLGIQRYNKKGERKNVFGRRFCTIIDRRRKRQRGTLNGSEATPSSAAESAQIFRKLAKGIFLRAAIVRLDRSDNARRSFAFTKAKSGVKGTRKCTETRVSATSVWSHCKLRVQTTSCNWLAHGIVYPAAFVRLHLLHCLSLRFVTPATSN